jgi:GT2 family glycosyltransferase
VIVPAKRLTALGRRCLGKLLELKDDRLEIVFVPDEAEEVDNRVVVLPSGNVPVGRKRQLGLERSRGRFVALMDDDAYPAENWLEGMLEAIGQRSVVAATGPTLTPADDDELARLGGRVYSSWLVAGPNRWRYRPERPRDVDEPTGVNAVFRRETAEKIGFASDYYPGDDTLLGDRLRDLGERVRYAPGMVVYHTRRRLWRPHLKQVWLYARHRGLFVWRIGGISRRPGYFLPSLFLLWAALGWLGPRSLDLVWAASLALYLLACLASAFDRRPGRWLRLALAIPLTHLTYAVGFLLGLACLPVPEERARRRRAAAKLV